MSFWVFRIVGVANIALCTGDISIGPPMSLHMFALATSFVLQPPPCVQPKVAFFFRHRFTCSAYLGGLSFDLCECFTLFNDEASNFLTFYTKAAKAVCDICNAKKSSQRKTDGSGETNKPKVCNANAKRFFIRSRWNSRIFGPNQPKQCRLPLWRNHKKRCVSTLVVKGFHSCFSVFGLKKCAQKSLTSEIRRPCKNTHF